MNCPVLLGSALSARKRADCRLAFDARVMRTPFESTVAPTFAKTMEAGLNVRDVTIYHYKRGHSECILYPAILNRI